VHFEGINERVIRYQEEFFDTEGDTARGVGYKSEEMQQLFFRVIRSMGIRPGSSVLDVGCGLAHFHDFLARSGHRGRYTGIDISPRSIKHARTRLPNADLRVQDLLDEGFVETFDFVVGSGIFTAKLDTSDDEFERFIEASVRKMYSLCRTGMVFNMLTSYVDFRVPHLYYADPGRYVALSKSLARHVSLKHDYEPGFFFTIGVYRKANEYGDAA
jgi:SAM-dependent methyltransferase